MPPEVEYEERELPAIEVPATNDGVRYALTDLRYQGQGEEYVEVNGHNGSNYRVVLLDSTGRRFPFRSGQPIEANLEPGVTYVALQPDGGNIAAGEVVLVPVVKSVKRNGSV